MLRRGSTTAVQEPKIEMSAVEVMGAWNLLKTHQVLFDQALPCWKLRGESERDLWVRWKTPLQSIHAQHLHRGVPGDRGSARLTSTKHLHEGVEETVEIL